MLEQMAEIGKREAQHGEVSMMCYCLFDNSVNM